MAYANPHEPGRLMDSHYDADTELLLDKERRRHEAANMPRSGFDGDLLFGKYQKTPYLTPQERQRQKAAERAAQGEVAE